MATITIDPFAGFCPGVNLAIDTVDELLETNSSVYSLGELVHCPIEINRLKSKGLNVINSEEIDKINDSIVLIRAHGVSPRTQYRLEISNNKVVDATCPTVHRLQQKIKTCSHEMKTIDGQVIIFGKLKHPEVEGLIGYCTMPAIVVEKQDDLSGIDLYRPMSIFAQTTTNVSDYEAFIQNLFKRLDEAGINKESVQIYNTICGSIKMRVPKLKLFANEHEVIIMVAGEESSNGIYLTSILKHENPFTYKVSSKEQLRKDWFADVSSIGITGAASTPEWLLKSIAAAVEQLIN